MNDSTPSQIKDILPYSTVAGASALPMPNVCQGMFHCYTLTQFCPPLRRLLAFPQLSQQGFVRMNTDAPARDARGTPRPQRTPRTSSRGKPHDATGRKRHRNAARTLQLLPLPIQREGTFRKIRPLPHRPGLAENRHLLGGFRRKFSFEAISGMISLYDQR